MTDTRSLEDIPDRAGRTAVKAIAPSAATGAWPTLVAATAELPSGTYVGPGALGQMAGTPQVLTSTSLSRDAENPRLLWGLGERTTGIRYP